MKKYGCEVTHISGETETETMCGKKICKMTKISSIKEITSEDILCPECQDIWEKKMISSTKDSN